MNKPTTQTEAPQRLTLKGLLREYIEIRRTTRVSVVDIISWFCASACLIATLYFVYCGGQFVWGTH